MLLALAVPVSASQVGLQLTSLEHNGDADLHGLFQGLSLGEAGPIAAIAGYGQEIRVETWNLSARSVAENNVNPVPGGIDATLSNASFASTGQPGNLVDVTVLPLGTALPLLSATGQNPLVQAASGDLTEVRHVDPNRAVASRTLGDALVISLAATGKMRIEGNFSLSIWDWNLKAGQTDLPTGSQRTNQVIAPIIGQELSADVVDQEARLTIREGWVEFDSVGPANLYADDLRVLLHGSATLSGLAGRLPTAAGLQVSHATLVLNGTSDLQLARQGAPFVSILRTDEALLDGRSIDLVHQSPGPRPGTTVSDRSTGTRKGWGAFASIVGIILAVGIIQGPVQRHRFRQLQARFENRRYTDVLQRIDSFTRRSRFQRKATFLKAVSLLSLEKYQDAARYLDELGARGPEPATRFFLAACAAAGLGQDRRALECLSHCFSIDPSYREEAATVPTLSALLARFDAAGGEAEA